MTFFKRQYRNVLLTAAAISVLAASGATAQSNVMFNKLNRRTAPAAKDSTARTPDEQRNTRVYRANRRGAAATDDTTAAARAQEERRNARFNRANSRGATTDDTPTPTTQTQTATPTPTPMPTPAPAPAQSTASTAPSKPLKESVEPLLKTRWNQRDPFNMLLPEKCGDNKAPCYEVGAPPAIGCSITAWAQVMKYYNHPKRRVKSAGVLQDVDYDWDNMLDAYGNSTERQRNAIAELMYDIARGWQEDPLAKGKNMWTVFGYDQSKQSLSRKYYDDDAWVAVIKGQLDSGIPVLYSSSGHEWVVDGYDNKGNFHANWGWGGWHNGYYPINGMKANSIFNHSNPIGQTIVINVKPDEGGAVSYAPALDSFAVAKTSVAQNEKFTVNAGINKQSTFPFSGQTGAALTDSKGNIVTVMGFVKLGSKYSIDCTVPETVKPGQYTLRIVTRPDGGNWEVVTLRDRIKGVPNAFNITVTPSR